MRGTTMPVALCGALLFIVVAGTQTPVRAAPASAWLEPESVTPAEESVRLDDITMAPDGTSHAVFHNYRLDDHRLSGSVRVPGGTWQDQAPMAGPPDVLGQPRVVVNLHGTAHAAWIQSSDRGVLNLRASVRPPGQAWRGTDSVSNGTTSVGEFEMATGGDGTTTLVWAQYQGGHEEPGRRTIYVSQRPAGGESPHWSKPVALSEPAHDSSRPHVAGGAGRRVTVAWVAQDGQDYFVQTARRSATGGWQDAQNLSRMRRPGSGPRVGADLQGGAYILWTRWNGTSYVAQVARRPMGGAWTFESKSLSGTGIDVESPSLQVDPLGNATAVWLATSEGGGTVQAVQRTAADGWGTPTDLSEAAADRRPPHLAMNAAGTALVAMTRPAGDQWVPQAVMRSRHGEWSVPVDLSSTPANIDNPRGALDARGNAVVGWSAFDETWSAAVAGFDGAGPVATMVRPATAFSLTPPNVRWTAADVWGDTASYRVRTVTASPTQRFGAPAIWLRQTDATTATFGRAEPGSTSCFAARARDTAGHWGRYSRWRCSAVPLNDRSLLQSGEWARADVARAYGGTLSRTAVKGATLTSRRVSARRIALVATRAPGGGTVSVYLGDRYLKTVRLVPTPRQDPATVYRRQVIPIATFAGRITGTVRIVARNGDPVWIEGLGVRAN